ncbi:unnamed protein product [Rotaria sordida]|uniref:Uncharacterized protein n=1 Tax=Rotaria sordida TaxID=392033 RepID=A0A818MFM2_9BILA|nr:unnamed protein product [Rotaria sordida]CAF3582094.1 unnamed protein product [Rotaria sordida]CAF4131753.1 unnamed protein product [Rotaria sordida]
MLSRISRRLINAHQYYTRQLLHITKKLNASNIDSNYYYQEFVIPTVAHVFNLSMGIYDSSKLDIDVIVLDEGNIRQSLTDGRQIFHPVKHDSLLLVNATL